MRTIANLLGAALLAATLSLSVTACKKKDKEDDHHHDHGSGGSSRSWVELGHGHDAGDRYHVDLYAELSPDRKIYEGYNRFRVKIIRADGTPYGGSDVRLLPMMYMSSGSHSCPTEQPAGPAEDGFYYGAAFFMMPTMENQPWKMHVVIGSDTVPFGITVDRHPDGWVKRGPIKGGSDSTRRYLRGMELARKAVGSQEVTFHVYVRDMSKSQTMPEGFPPARHVSKIRVTTWMPSMGHGAEGSQDAMPVDGKPGHFKGKAGFNMTGDWEVIATYLEGETELGRDTFALDF